MMLGTAASNSTILDTTTLITSGAISARKIAIPRLMGTPIMTAIRAVTRVPKMYGRAPKPTAASQLVPVRKLRPNFVNAGKAPWTKTTNDIAIIAITETAKISEPYLKKPSEEGCLRSSKSFCRFSRSDNYCWLHKTHGFRRDWEEGRTKRSTSQSLRSEGSGHYRLL